MDPWRDVERSIRAASGASFAVESSSPVGGGCINECHVIRGHGQAYFVKLNTPDRAGMFVAEAAGLDEIGKTRTVLVPRTICHGVGPAASWIVLEHLELRCANDSSMRELGRKLASMHRATAPQHGWALDNTIGATPQLNTPADGWPLFWRERRLGFQLRLAVSNGYGGRLIETGNRLMEKLSAFFAGYHPAPSLLHGDLWAGNAAATAGGEPVVFDPAVYYGDRETDLAMTELFGGFPPAFYEAYRAGYPLDTGYAMRKDLYNLYHVLNHLNLFGGGYRAQAERMIGQLLARV